MDARLGRRIADDTDRLAWTFARAGVRLSSLATHRQTAQVPHAAITLDRLQPLEIHADLAAQITFDYVFTILDRVDDLRELLFGQILRPNARIDLGLLEHDFGVARADAIDITQRDINPLIRRHFHSDN